MSFSTERSRRFYAQGLLAFSDAAKQRCGLTDIDASVDLLASQMLQAAGAVNSGPPVTSTAVALAETFNVPENCDDPKAYISASLAAQGFHVIVLTAAEVPAPTPAVPSAEQFLARWMERLPQDADPRALTRLEVWHMTGVNRLTLARLTKDGKLAGELRDGTWFYDLHDIAKRAPSLRAFTRPNLKTVDVCRPGYRRHVPACNAETQ